MKMKQCITSTLLLLLLSWPATGAQQTSAKQTSPPSSLRIIALAPHIVEMLFEIGVGKQIVATTQSSDYPIQANEIPRVGNYARLKIEQILAYQPDLIIAWKTGNPSDDLAKLKQLGLNIVYSDPVALEDIAKELRWLGQLTGAKQQAEIKAKAFETELAKLRQQYQQQRPVSVFYELWARPLTTVANEAWPQQHIKLCGGSNLFDGSKTDYPQISLEQVVVKAPQLIIQPMSAGEPNPDAINWQLWPLIPAVKNSQFIQPNSDKLHRMTSRLLPELTSLCQQIDKSRQFYFKPAKSDKL